jgi:hypothetical protein
MADWATISSLATAGGTVVLAVATFSSVRSANRSARVAEEALLVSLRPLLMPSRPEDPHLKVSFGDDHWTRVPGGRGTIELADEAIYLTMSLRNAGSGIAVLHGWRPVPRGEGPATRPSADSFRRLTRDIYIPAHDVYFWQGAIRDRDHEDWTAIAKNVADGERQVIDLLYGDDQGRQRVIGRFHLVPTKDDTFVVTVVRRWNVDRADPR